MIARLLSSALLAALASTPGHAEAPPPRPIAIAAVDPAIPTERPSPAQPSASAADFAILRDAVAAYRKGDIAAGDALRARASDPGVGLLLDWMALRSGGALIGLERVHAFGRAYPDWPGTGWLRRRAEEALLAERRPAEFVRLFFARERPVGPAGKLALAGALKASGLGEDAADLVRDAWRNDVFGRELELRFLDAFPDAVSLSDHRFRMERMLHKENWDGARRAAEFAGKGYEALVKARVAVSGRAANAPKLIAAVPPALKSDSSFAFSQVQSLRRADKIAEAVKIVGDLPDRDPAVLADGDAWWIERRLLARELLDRGDANGAYRVAAGHGATTAERRIEAEFHAGWIALRFLNDPALARRHFDRAAPVAGTPISLARVAYWQGRAAEQGGAAAEAKGLYAAAAQHGTTYYGQLAGARLGSPQLPLRLPPETGSSVLASPVVGAVRAAYAAGMRELAAPLLAELGRGGTDPAILDAAVDVAVENRDARSVLALGKAASQRGLPLDEAAFPIEGVPSFEAIGKPVERAMVHAIARQESAFDPAALSTAGARGLMQLMPGTAQMTAKKAGIEYEPARLGDAVYNARLGAAHLGDLMDDWRGSYILVFASYNAGPGNARKWINAYGDPRRPDVDAVDWVERIPFSETRNYVQRVMENLQVYRKRLDARSALLIESDLKRGGAPAQP